jgi:hypothetical protein
MSASTVSGEHLLAPVKSPPLAIKRHSGKRFEAGRFMGEHGADMTPQQIDFGRALDAYKRKYQRPHPTSSQVLDVLKAMGYRLVAPAVTA